MDDQIKAWHESVAAKFGMTSDEFVVEHFDWNQQIDLMHHILARGNEASSTVVSCL